MKSLLEEAIKSGEDARTGAIAEVENIPPKDFAFRPAEGVRSISELVVHIMEVGLMMVGELTRNDGDFKRKAYTKLIDEYAAAIQDLTRKRDLLATLRRTFREGVTAFR